MEIHIFRNGAEQGPYQEGTVRRMLDGGLLRPSDHAWRDGLPEWVPLADFLAGRAQATAARPAVEEQTRPATDDAAPVEISLPSTTSTLLPQGEPASPKQKAFLSYMGITFGPGLTKEQAAFMVNDAMENPADPARLGRWTEDRLRLHPDIFGAELKAKKEDRPNHFHTLVTGEGAECFKNVSKAHCQVLVSYLDVRFPNWDARENDALWNYFFPALAEKFPQLVTKPWRGKLHFPEGPKVAAELKQAAPELPPLRRGPRLVLRILALLVLLGALGFAGYYLATHPQVLQEWRRFLPKTAAAPEAKDTGAALSTPNPPAGEMPIPESPSPNPASTPGAAEKAPSAPAATPASGLFAVPPPPPAQTGPVSSIFPPPTAPTPAAAPAQAPVVAHASDTVTVLQPLDVQLTYGKVRITPGTVLKIVAREGSYVRVMYMNKAVSIPASATDLR